MNSREVVFIGNMLLGTHSHELVFVLCMSFVIIVMLGYRGWKVSVSCSQRPADCEKHMHCTVWTLPSVL